MSGYDLTRLSKVTRHHSNRKTEMLRMPIRSASWFALLACFSFSQILPTAHAQAPVAGVISPAASAPKSIAVLAATGDQFQYVRRKPAAASRIEPFVRRWVTMPGNVLNMMVLRGMNRALTGQYPDVELTRSEEHTSELQSL